MILDMLTLIPTGSKAISGQVGGLREGSPRT